MKKYVYFNVVNNNDCWDCIIIELSSNQSSNPNLILINEYIIV